MKTLRKTTFLLEELSHRKLKNLIKFNYWHTLYRISDLHSEIASKNREIMELK